jgi:hypothetical protein
MAGRLKKSPKIWKLAKDLGIRSTEDPVSDILHYCERKIKTFLKDFPDCNTLSSLLDWVAGKVRTTFEEVRTDDDLIQIKQKYLKRGERIFVTLDGDLRSEDNYGITYKLTNREPWEPMFVSVIDCRGNKGLRSYYTKWHEIAHLLVLTDQMRLTYQRTLHLSANDPEEALVDIIAGNFGFYAPIIKRHAKDEISFEIIEELCSGLCPESSYLASLIGFVKSWPKPCILTYCRPAFKRKEEEMLLQGGFDFCKPPEAFLRATKITLSDGARKDDFRIFENMRVPTASIINDVYNGFSNYSEAEENLSWWATSDGLILPDRPIRTKAKRLWDSVYALIIPH